MSITREEAIKALHEREHLFVVYSQATRLPYVVEAEDTANDQVWVFATEEELKEFGKKKLDEKILLMGMKYERKDYPRLYGTFFLIGANSIVWNDGEDQIEVELTDVAHQADFSNVEPEKRPLFNPGLQLCSIYFMQEVRRPLPREDRAAVLRPLEEELIANLKRSEFLVGMSVDKDDPKKINIPYLKNKEDKILQPFFTDIMEFEKFARGKQLRAAKLSFDKLINILMEQSAGFVMNPLGVNLILEREQMARILATMGIAMPTVSPKADEVREPGQDSGSMASANEKETETTEVNN